jgi:methylated-DNA-protein-cysteine methyltransferase-like protein
VYPLKKQMHNEKTERIWQAVYQIPKGKVASYGQIAQLAGLPNAARYVGSVLRRLPRDTQLPWHRVITAQGKLAFPAQSPPWREQRGRLIDEGITFTGERIAMKVFGWKP